MKITFILIYNEGCFDEKLTHFRLDTFSQHDSLTGTLYFSKYLNNHLDYQNKDCAIVFLLKIRFF